MVQDVRLPPGKNFAFVEFVSHQAALAVVAGEREVEQL